MSAALRVVASTSAPAAPYPADVRAKGWRFELDHERIEQSDTWALSPADMRPWLLMLWMTAWKQTPCGSLPANDELIAARIGLPVRQFAANRDLLLRGWVLHDDGRLYHQVITEQVMAYIEHCRREAKRKAEWRAKKAQCPTYVPRDRHVEDTSATTPEPEPEPEERHTPNAPSEHLPPKGKRKPAAGMDLLLKAGVEEQTAADWLTLRRAKKLPLTPTAMSGVVTEAAAAGIPVHDAVREAVERGWGSFKAAWLTRDSPRATPSRAPDREPEWRREQRERNEAFLGPYAAKRTRNVIDMEVPDGTAKLLD